jgi:hypothetical protein
MKIVAMNAAASEVARDDEGNIVAEVDRASDDHSRGLLRVSCCVTPH